MAFNPLVLLYIMYWGKKNVYFDICIEKKQSELATNKTKR